MGALSDLLGQRHMAANPAKTANLPPVRDSQDSQDSQGGAPVIRAHLLALAADEYRSADLVHRLGVEDVAACAGLSDEALRTYLRVLERQAIMDRGLVPEGFTQEAHCHGCGPVWLWPESPARVAACPWCFRRKAGKPLPRPPVTCGSCRHYLPDPINPAAGAGSCALGPGRALWPMAHHPCVEHRPSQGAADGLMVSYSVEVTP